MPTSTAFMSNEIQWDKKMTKRFKVVSIHFCSDCNLSCPMCYRKKREGEPKPFSFFKELIPYIAELTDQVALEGGETFLHPGVIMSLGRTCKKNGLIMNVTTNGTQKMKPEYVKDIEMVSISLDKYKRPRIKDLARYAATVQQLKKHTRVGTNLLIDKEMMKRKSTFPMLVKWLFENVEVERVFALYPKNWEFIDILPLTDIYAALSTMYKHFYVDDLSHQVLTEKRYSDWKGPCHYGADIISLNEFGEVTGCSFDGPEKAMLKLEKPEDILDIKKVKFEERHSCPYLKEKEVT